MSSPFKTTLLRRTAALLAAASVVLLVPFDASAQGTVTLSGTTSNSCSYSALSVLPNGSVAVTCSGGSAPPPPPPPPTCPATGCFTLNASSYTTAASTPVSVTVLRTGGNSGAFIVPYTLSGSGCAATQPSSYAYFTGGTGTTDSQTVSIAVTTGGTCAITLGTPYSASASGAILAAPSSANITVGSGGGSPPPPLPPTGCPAAPADMLTTTLVGPGNVRLQMQASGQVVSIPLPSISNAMARVAFGESSGAYTPDPVTLEVSINPCPGQINTDLSNACNLRSTNRSLNSIYWVARPTTGADSPTAANANGYCWAADGGTYYINARWTYSACSYGVSTCGFAIDYN